jgi:hypothetical protein
MSAENLFSNPLKVVNVGLRSFAQDLRSQGVECQQVDSAQASPADPDVPGSAAGAAPEGE